MRLERTAAVRVQGVVECDRLQPPRDIGHALQADSTELI